MKEHILAKMINELRDTAVKYHDHDCLRELIRTTVLQAFHDDAEWYREYGKVAGKTQITTVPDMRIRMPENKDYMTKILPTG